MAAMPDGTSANFLARGAMNADHIAEQPVGKSYQSNPVDLLESRACGKYTANVADKIQTNKNKHLFERKQRKHGNFGSGHLSDYSQSPGSFATRESGHSTMSCWRNKLMW